jgi:DNA repair protein RadA/Sms
MQIQTSDAYVNVVGGLKIDEPACDLGIACAIASSFRGIPINNMSVAIGEIGLTGEIRGVSFIEKRIIEAQKLGFSKCIIPRANYKGLDFKPEIEIIAVENIYEALDIILGG